MTQTYNHMFTIAFEVAGSKSPTGNDVNSVMLKQGLQRRIAQLDANPGEWIEATGKPDDTYTEEPRKTYDVIVTRDTTESCTMLIEALNENEAHNLALQRAAEDSDLVWEGDFTPNASKQLYVTSCETSEELSS